MNWKKLIDKYVVYAKESTQKLILAALGALIIIGMLVENEAFTSATYSAMAIYVLLIIIGAYIRMKKKKKQS